MFQQTENISKGTEIIREPGRYPEVESICKLKNTLDGLKNRAELEKTESVSWKIDWVGYISVKTWRKVNTDSDTMKHDDMNLIGVLEEENSDKDQ